MCVDDKELSAYIDGELSPQAQEAIAAHIEQCSTCSERFESMHGVSRLMRDSSEVADSEDRLARSWNRIDVSVRRRSGPSIWSRHLKLSAPAAAAAAFVLVLLGGLSAFFFGAIYSPDTGQPNGIPVVERSEEREEVSFRKEKREPTRKEMEELIRFLSERGASIELKIELPQPSNFTVYGEPQLIRAADFTDFKENTVN